MFNHIQKRDRRIVEFDSSRITLAIAKAGKATGEFNETEAKGLSVRVLKFAHRLNPSPVPHIEEIQDAVERVLIDSPYYKTAKAYILYREQHTKTRDILAKANMQLVENYLEELDWKVSENSNVSYSLQGFNNYLSSEIVLLLTELEFSSDYDSYIRGRETPWQISEEIIPPKRKSPY